MDGYSLGWRQEDPPTTSPPLEYGGSDKPHPELLLQLLAPMTLCWIAEAADSNQGSLGDQAMDSNHEGSLWDQAVDRNQEGSLGDQATDSV